jgi:hypothetical protein
MFIHFILIFTPTSLKDLNAFCHISLQVFTVVECVLNKSYRVTLFVKCISYIKCKVFKKLYDVYKTLIASRINCALSKALPKLFSLVEVQLI